jgi:hypothetical protein
LDFVAVEALVSDLQKSTEGTERRQLFGGITEPLLRSDDISHGGSLCALTETVRPLRSGRRACLNSK